MQIFIAFYYRFFTLNKFIVNLKKNPIVENKIIKIEGITLLVAYFQESMINIGIIANESPK